MRCRNPPRLSQISIATCFDAQAAAVAGEARSTLPLSEFRDLDRLNRQTMAGMGDRSSRSSRVTVATSPGARQGCRAFRLSLRAERSRPHIGVMHLDLSDEETAALLKQLPIPWGLPLPVPPASAA